MSAFRDVRYFLRSLGRQPGFALTVVLSLAVGIGANTVMFSVARRILLEQLAARDPESLVLLKWRAPEFPAESLSGSISFAGGTPTSTSFSYPAYQAFAKNARTIRHLVAFSAIDRLNISMRGTPAIGRGAMVSGNYYGALGVGAAAGRTLDANDDMPGAEPAAMLSYSFWRNAFGGERGVIGSPIVLNGKPFTIVGIESSDFKGTLEVGNEPQIIVPIAMQKTLFGATDVANASSWWLQLIGRRGAPDAQIAAELSVLLQQQVRAANPSFKDPGAIRVDILPGARGLFETRDMLREPVMILAGAVSLVLLIACMNVAGLLLARATARRKEVAVRMSLGASRATLIRQMLTESIVLALIGGAAGLALAFWLRPLVPLILPNSGMPVDIDVPLNMTVLLFTAGVCVLTGVVFGLVPALRATRLDLAAVTADASTIGSRQRNRLANALMVAQIALSIVLMIGCGLFLRSLVKLQSVPPGFDPEQLLLFRLDPTLNGYEGSRLTQFYDDVLARVRAIPGVRIATPTRYTLISGQSHIGTLFIDGREAQEAQREYAYLHIVGEQFLEAMRTPVILGRGLTADDREGAPKVMLIGQSVAQKYFPDQNPIGQHIGFSKENSAEYEVVGVVRDSRYTSLKEEIPLTVYLAYRQYPGDRSLSFAVRTAADPETLIDDVRAAVQRIDANVPLFDVKTQTAQIADSMRHERALAALATFFGLVALLLSCIGLYGLMSYVSARRTRETGVRIALGARSRDISSDVLRRALLLVIAGVTLGATGAFALTRYVKSMVFGVEPNDPVSIGLSIAAMTFVALAASWIPARRASKIDPVVALRTE